MINNNAGAMIKAEKPKQNKKKTFDGDLSMCVKRVRWEVETERPTKLCWCIIWNDRSLSRRYDSPYPVIEFTVCLGKHETLRCLGTVGARCALGKTLFEEGIM